MANYLRVLAIALLAASAFSPLLSYVAGVDCNAVYHSSAITSQCSPGTPPSDECCGAVVATLAAGGARCLCLASHLAASVSAGFTVDDFEYYYDTCGGTGDYNAEFTTCTDTGTAPPILPPPASSPPPPPSALPPPPPQLQVEVKEEIPWWHWVLEWFMSLVGFLIVVVLLFLMVKCCSGRAGDIAAKALERMLCIAPIETRVSDSSTRRPAHSNDSSHHHSIEMSEVRTTQKTLDNGDEISLIANHFAIRILNSDIMFYRYTVSIKSMDDKVVHGKYTCRRVLNKMQQGFGSQLGYKHLVYDGYTSVFTVGPLPHETFEFTVSLDKTHPRSEGICSDVGTEQVEQEHFTERFRVAINYSAKVSLATAMSASQGMESGYALRVLDNVLRQQQAKRGYLIMKNSYFSHATRNLVDLNGGLSLCFGISAGFCFNLDGLTLNMDVSTSIVVTPGPVLGFILACQNVTDVNDIDWPQANEMLKELRVATKHNDMEFKIIGLSDQPCSRQNFKTRLSSGRTSDITVQDYFLSKRGIKLTMPSLPCLDVGKPNNPCYLPIELCHILSLQRYTKALSSQQRAFFLEKSRQRPEDQVRVINDARQEESYEDDPILSSCGVKIEKQLTRLSGCVLPAPTLVVGNSEVCIPNGGRWSYSSKMLLDPVKIRHWAIVNFSATCDTNCLSKDLINFGHRKGISIETPHALVNEKDKSRKCSPTQRVELMFKRLIAKSHNLEFLLCVLPERKNCDIYGPWKKKCLLEMGIATQCIAPCAKMNDKYFDNVLLKINAKLGGLNWNIALKQHHMIPAVTRFPTLILGMDVCHGPSGRADIPSVAAVVGSRCWPQFTRYSASIRTQLPKAEIIHSLFTPLHNGLDVGMIRELLMEFYDSSQRRKPSQIIIFRDGVSDSQFTQVLDVELDQIIKAYDNMGWDSRPKFTVIVAQKNHQTKFFQSNSTENIPAGMVVDSVVVKPRYQNFYICAHTGVTGTSRPTHYYVLLDEIGFARHDLQELVHSLSYLNQRSTSANSVVAPIRYAHLAAAQMGKLVKCQEFVDTERENIAPVPQLPRLHHKISNSMFFC